MNIGLTYENTELAQSLAGQVWAQSVPPRFVLIGGMPLTGYDINNPWVKVSCVIVKNEDAFTLYGWRWASYSPENLIDKDIRLEELTLDAEYGSCAITAKSVGTSSGDDTNFPGIYQKAFEAWNKAGRPKQFQFFGYGGDNAATK